MLCSLCKKFGRPPTQANGAWVTRPIYNWVKATELLAKHERSDWHRASVEASALAEMAKNRGDIIEQMRSANEEEKCKNREMLKKLIRSLYFLSYTTYYNISGFDHITKLKMEMPMELQVHLNSCPNNATYIAL